MLRQLILHRPNLGHHQARFFAQFEQNHRDKGFVGVFPAEAAAAAQDIAHGIVVAGTACQAVTAMLDSYKAV